jgi:hypothetical protein
MRLICVFVFILCLCYVNSIDSVSNKNEEDYQIDYYEDCVDDNDEDCITINDDNDDDYDSFNGTNNSTSQDWIHPNLIDYTTVQFDQNIDTSYDLILLRRMLLNTGYLPQTRPLNDSTKSINVKFALSIIQINQIHESMMVSIKNFNNFSFFN